MFTRIRKSSRHQYLQVVENHREDGKTRQRVPGTLGRLDRLRKSGALDGLVRSLAVFSERSIALSSARRRSASGAAEPGDGMPTRQIGPALVFDRLWEESGCREVIAGLAAGRRHGFDLERVIFFSVLHRLMRSGSDRRAEKWGATQKIRGLDRPQLQHLYRAMAWLGEELPAGEQAGRTRAPRCVKDRVEERLFLRRRSLFSRLDLVFFDTTSLSFHGEGGEEPGRRGHSKDERPELKQIVLDEKGTPVCMEMWPGNATDAKSLLPVAERLGTRFGVRSVCLVADQGMTSREVMEQIERRGWKYVLGARMRTVKEVREKVLSDGSAFREVPAPAGSGRERVAAKEVLVRDEKGERRYVVCRSEARAERDRRAREEMLAKLREELRSGAKGLLRNRGCARYLTAEKTALRIDPEKTRTEERHDGMWVLRSNAGWSAAETARRYEELWRVERMFRAAKSELKTRPAFHRTDAAIRGHVFCTFLALVLRRELYRRLEQAEQARQAEEARKTKATRKTPEESGSVEEGGNGAARVEWQDVVADLATLSEGVIEQDGKRFVVRSQARGVTSRVFRDLGMALPPVLRQEQAPTLAP